ncbi:MAG: DUF420 domain-containing protein [Acidobacteriota bacterium]
MSLAQLTTLSTSFIVGSGIALLAGWYFIRVQKSMERHRASMLAATSLAGLFLVAYVTRWAMYGSKSFEGEGLWKVLYLSILLPHILLAIAVGPMALRLIYLALGKGDFRRHKRLARVTLPVWLFVAASGWVIYYMLYVMKF